MKTRPLKSIRFALSLDPRPIFFTLGAVVCPTILLSVLGVSLQHPESPPQPYSFFSYFAMGRANTAPAFVASFSLLLASLLLMIVAKLTSPEKIPTVNCCNSKWAMQPLYAGMLFADVRSIWNSLATTYQQDFRSLVMARYLTRRKLSPTWKWSLHALSYSQTGKVDY